LSQKIVFVNAKMVEAVTLLYEVFGENDKSLGIVYVTDCPNLELAEQLHDYGGAGSKFLDLMNALFPDDTLTKIELLLYQSNKVPRHDASATFPWTSVYTTVNPGV
jgi:hypothetical protein